MAEEQLGPTIEAAKKQGSFFGEKMPFDYEKARAEGATDEQIADYLAQETGYDIKNAYAEGAAPTDVIVYLSDVKDAPFTALTRGVQEGGSLSAGMVTGGVAGFQAGMVAAPFLGPFAPVAPIVGAGIGALSGLALANKLNDFFIPDDKFVNTGMRAAGETFGASISPLPVPYTLAAKSPGLAASMFISEYAKKQGGKGVYITSADKMLQTIQRSPGLFGAYETGAAGAAAVAGGASESADPGNILKRMGAEMGAAIVLNPMNIVTRAAGPVREGVKRIMSRFSADTRQHKIGEMIVKALNEAGEDPAALADALKAIDLEGAQTEMQRLAAEKGVDIGKLSTAAQVQSPVLAQLQASLRKNARVGPTLDNAALNNLEKVTDVVDLLVQMDDPEALALAADLQLAQYEGTLSALLNQAEAKAVETAASAFTGTQASAAKAGDIIVTMTKDVLDQARNQEKALYTKIDKKEPAEAGSVIAKFDELTGELLPESPFPSLIRRFVGRVSGRDMDVPEDAVVGQIAALNKELAAAQKKFKTLSAKGGVAEDELFGAYPDLFRQPQGGNQKAIRDLGNIVADYRAKGSDQRGSSLDSTTRNRVAQLAEAKIAELLATEEITFLRSQQSRATAEAAEQVSELPEITVGDLTAFRSEMLSMARDARAAGNFRDSNFYGQMAEAALEDLGLGAQIPAGEMPTKNQMNLKAAHNFSRALNDTFRRAFAGDLLSKNKTGASNLPPELVADKILGGSANATNLRLLQLQDVARFMATNAGEEFAGTTAANLDTLKGAQETILRSAATRFYNPETGRVNMAALGQWSAQNAETLAAFPSLRSDLSSAGTAYKVLADTKEKNSLFSRKLNDQLSLSAFMGADERPGDMIGQLIADPGNRSAVKTPGKNLNAAMLSARRAGENVFNGLRSAILDHAFVYAGGDQGKMNMKAFQDYFTKPLARGQDSVLSIMRQQGMFSDSEAVRFNQLLKETTFVEQKILQGKGAELDVGDMPPAVFDLVVRVIGAREGTRLAKSIGMPNSIQLPGYFAQFARNRFSNMPSGYFTDLIVEAAENPKMMENLIRKGMDKKSGNQQIKFNRQLNSALISAGFLPTREEVENLDILPTGLVIPPAQAETSSEEIQQYLNSLNTPPSQPAPVNLPNTAPPSVVTGAPPVRQVPPRPPAAGQPNSTERQNYATLFPNDPISGLINSRQQGPR